MIPTRKRVPALFQFRAADGLGANGALIARSYGSELTGLLTRTSRKWVADQNGLLVPVNHSVPPLTVVGGEHALLLEPASTNLCIESESFDAWDNAFTCNVTANATVAPDNATTMDLLTATEAGSERRQPVTFTGDGEKVAFVHLQADTSATVYVSIADSTAGVQRHRVRVDWLAGVPTVTTNTGTGTIFDPVYLNGSWWIAFSATGIVAANANSIRITPDPLSGVGTVYAWGAQAENAVVPSSYIPTAGSTVTRNGDTLYFPFTAPPQEQTVYVRGVDAGNYAQSSGWFYSIQSAAAGNPRLIGLTSSGKASAYYENTSPVLSTPAAGAASLGDIMEHRTVLYANGSVRGATAVNAGAESIGSQSAPAGGGLGAAWSDARFYVAHPAGSRKGFAYTHVVVAAGERTIAEMRALAEVG